MANQRWRLYFSAGRFSVISNSKLAYQINTYSSTALRNKKGRAGRNHPCARPIISRLIVENPGFLSLRTISDHWCGPRRNASDFLYDSPQTPGMPITSCTSSTNASQDRDGDTCKRHWVPLEVEGASSWVTTWVTTISSEFTLEPWD